MSDENSVIRAFIQQAMGGAVDPADRVRAQKILDANKGMNFVERVINPNIYPVLNNEDGSVSTHSMASGEGDGRYYAYPTVVQEGDRLKRLEDADAWRHASRTGERIEFSTPEEADWFARNYKSVWGR